jgi:hypothetical protein
LQSENTKKKTVSVRISGEVKAVGEADSDVDSDIDSDLDSWTDFGRKSESEPESSSSRETARIDSQNRSGPVCWSQLASLNLYNLLFYFSG